MSEHRVALVTGSSRGIGRGIALGLAPLGYRIVVNYVHDESSARETARLVEQAGGGAMLCRADVAVADERRRMVLEAITAFGRIDMLVNNAGVSVAERVDLLDATESSWDRVLNINLKGPYFLSQLVAREMIRLQVARGKIINISSVSAYAGSTNRGEYCVAKAGLSMATQLFADRLAEHGIQVFEIRPGVIESDMTAAARAKYEKLIAEGFTPIRRWGRPIDVAKAVVAIADDDFPFSTGEVLNVDGGFHLRRL